MADEASPAANGPNYTGGFDWKGNAWWGTAFPLIISAIVFAVGAFAVGGVAWVLDKFTDVGVEVVLPILLIYGVVTLLVAISVLATILSAYEQNRTGGALGLPEGSVPAVIALILVLIFAITAVFLATLPQGPDGISEQFATQILTTTGTLAVAVAGFYFGSRAVETGAATVSGQSVVRGVTITSPPSPATLPKAIGEALAIRVTATPQDAQVTWRLTGDPDGEVVQLSPGEFEYRRGASPADEVTIRFEVAGDPTAAAELQVLPSAAESAVA